jgi:2-methylcitrate dehydratase PrpD
MTKPLHVGHAARSGVTATLLASRGFTADAEAFEMFGELYMEGRNETTSELRLEENWLLLSDPTYHLKKYPCCGNSHAAIAGALKLLNDNDFDLAEVESINVTAPEYTRADLQYSNPDSGLEAKFSMEYSLAKALVGHGLSLGDFAHPEPTGSLVDELRQRVNFETTSEVRFGNFDTVVEIQLTDARTLRTTQYDAPGTHENPLTTSELKSKFMACATQSIGKPDAERAFEQLDEIASVDDTSELWQSLQL